MRDLEFSQFLGKLSTQLVHSMQEFIATPEGRSANASLVKATARKFPQYWEELEGIIEGSGVPRELVGYSQLIYM